MLSTIKSDETFSILTNYLHQRDLSNYSVVETSHRRVKDDSGSENKVDKRTRILEWIKDVAKLSENAMSNIHDIRLSDTVNVNEKIEQEKLAVLNKIGWVYKGNFHKKKFADAYPELSFSISTRKQSGKYWYEVSYGIMRGVEDIRYGSYNLFVTLDDAIEYIEEELNFTGRKVLRRHYFEDALRREKEERGKNILSSSEQREVVKDKKPKIDRTIASVLNEENIYDTLLTVRRASDISTLNDFARNLLIPEAYKRLEEAKNNQREKQRAEELVEDTTINLDIVDKSQQSSELIPPAELRSSIQNDNVPTAGIVSDTLPKVDVSPDDIQGGAIFDLDSYNPNEDISQKPLTSILNISEDNNEIHPEEHVGTSTNEELIVNNSVFSEYNDTNEELIVNNSVFSEYNDTNEELVANDNVFSEYNDTNEELDYSCSPIQEQNETIENISPVNDDIDLIEEHNDIREEIKLFEALFEEKDGVVLTDDDIKSSLRKALPEMFDTSRLPVVEKDNNLFDDEIDDFLNEQ